VKERTSMSRLRMEIAVAGLAALGFILFFVMHFHGWSPDIVRLEMYATVFMVAFLGSWLGLGGVGKLNLWQSVGVASGAVLFVLLAWR
jgi:hypothetical protein